MTVLTVDLGFGVALKRELDLLRPVEELSAEDARELFLKTKPKNTAKAYRGDLRNWFEFCALVDTDVFEVDGRYIEVYLGNYLSKQAVVYTEADTAPLALASVKRKIAAIRSFYAYCMDKGIIKTNPIPSDKALSVKGATSQTLGPDASECRAMLAACESPTELAVIRVLIHQGWRVSELCAADVEDVRQERGHRVINLHRKGNKSQDQTLAPEAVAAIDAVAPLTGPLVPSETGSRLTRDAVARIVSEVARRAGIRRHYTPHSIRHSCVTLLLDSGVSVPDTQAFMGHANVETTMRYDLGRKVLDGSPAYAHVL